MIFSSSIFIFIFLPIVLILYYISSNRTYRNIILLIFSIIFYAWGDPKYVILILLSILINYILTLLLDRFRKIKIVILILGIIINIGLLLYFKLFQDSIGAIPLGISFYTFQIVSYVIDVYREKTKAQKNIINLAVYISLFSQLIVGPIVRYETVEDQLTNRKENLNDFILGLKRFILGLGKKVIIANHVAIVATTIYGMSIELVGTLEMWIAAVAFTLEIYFDFSGYSDMAIGLSQMFGFKLLENFNYPYIATSVTEFWRRWHISLSSWFKDYIYIPLGGNKVSMFHWIVNMLLVWLLTALWHGTSWNFILWGLYYALILILEKTIFKKLLNKTPKLFKWIITIFITIIGFVIFNTQKLNTLIAIFNRLFIFTQSNFNNILLNNYTLITGIPYIIIGIIFSFPYINNWFNKITSKNIFCEGLGYIVYLIIFITSISMILIDSYNPFIYFQY